MQTVTALGFRYTQSNLELAKCLYRFNEQINKGVPRPQNEASTRGTDMHELHSRYVEHLAATSQETDYEFAHEIASDPKYDGNAVSLFKGWVQIRTFDPAKIVGTEITIRLTPELTVAPPDASKEQSPWSGTFDRLEVSGDEANIWDLKTHFAAFKPNTIQAVMYPWLLRKMMPKLKRITFSLDFIRWNIIRSREFTAEEIDALEPYILNLGNRLLVAHQANEWPASPNDKCAWCQLECPLVAAGMDRAAIGQVGTPAEATQIAEELFALEARAKQLTNALRNYAAEYGPVTIANRIQLGYAKQSKLETPAFRVHALNKVYGFDPLRALNVDGRELKKIGKQYPDYLAELAPHRKDRSTTKFGFRSLIDPELEEHNEDDDE